MEALSTTVADEVRRTVSAVMIAELPELVRNAVGEEIRALPVNAIGQSKPTVENPSATETVTTRKSAATRKSKVKKVIVSSNKSFISGPSLNIGSSKNNARREPRQRNERRREREVRPERAERRTRGAVPDRADKLDIVERPGRVTRFEKTQRAERDLKERVTVGGEDRYKRKFFGKRRSTYHEKRKAIRHSRVLKDNCPKNGFAGSRGAFRKYKKYNALGN